MSPKQTNIGDVIHDGYQPERHFPTLTIREKRFGIAAAGLILASVVFSQVGGGDDYVPPQSPQMARVIAE